MNYLRVLWVIFFLNGFSFFIYSCCEEVYEVIPDQLESSFSQYIDENQVISVDSVTGPFVYDVYAEIERIGLKELGSLSINSAYATSCAEYYENTFVKEATKVSLNRPIIFDGQVFEAGKNLLDLDENYTADIYNAQVGPGHIRIWFKEPILLRSEFEEGMYEFHAYAETTRGDVLERRDTVFISL